MAATELVSMKTRTISMAQAFTNVNLCPLPQLLFSKATINILCNLSLHEFFNIQPLSTIMRIATGDLAANSLITITHQLLR